MDETRENSLACACCGCEIDDDDYYLVEGDVVCPTCYEDECGSCDRCGTFIYSENAVTDSDHFLCQCCYDDHYTRCYDCDRIVHNDDSYYADGYDFCYNCYEKHSSSIREYSYKPTPILYGQGKRFLGVELEVDNGGHDGVFFTLAADTAEIGDSIYSMEVFFDGLEKIQGSRDFF